MVVEASPASDSEKVCPDAAAPATLVSSSAEWSGWEEMLVVPRPMKRIRHEQDCLTL